MTAGMNKVKQHESGQSNCCLIWLRFSLKPDGTSRKGPSEDHSVVAEPSWSAKLNQMFMGLFCLISAFYLTFPPYILWSVFLSKQTRIYSLGGKVCCHCLFSCNYISCEAHLRDCICNHLMSAVEVHNKNLLNIVVI